MNRLRLCSPLLALALLAPLAAVARPPLTRDALPLVGLWPSFGEGAGVRDFRGRLGLWIAVVAGRFQCAKSNWQQSL